MRIFFDLPKRKQRKIKGKEAAVSEIRKTCQNKARDCLMWYYRDKENHEIDMVIEQDGVLHPIEIKKSVKSESRMLFAFGILDKGSVPGAEMVRFCVCRPNHQPLIQKNYIVPIWMI